MGIDCYWVNLIVAKGLLRGSARFLASLRTTVVGIQFLLRELGVLCGSLN